MLAWACALAVACGREPAGGVAPTPGTAGASPAPAIASPVPTGAPGVAARCSVPTSAERLAGPSAERPADLDLQFHWRAATVCQELHELEQGNATFRPLERLAIHDGAGHRVLLLLPSLGGAASTARYRVDLADAPEAELRAWLMIEESAARSSDGVEFALGVGAAEGDPAAIPLRFERLTSAAGEAGWREVRLDLAPWRGKAVWVVLAAREPGDRSGDWLLWGDPRVVVKQPPPLRVDLRGGAAGGPAADGAVTRELAAVPWSEANVFKAYSGFNEEKAASLNPSWVERMFPWIGALRLFASLGASWGPTLARDYDAQMGHNPTRDSREERHWAEYYEFFRDGPGWEGRPIAERFDWQHFDALYARIASTGVRMHVNLAGAPELFTAGRGHYHTYHYNEMPVVDEAGWKQYVGEVFRHLSHQPWFARAEFSFFSEPNCRWVADDGSVRHFGYQGDAAQYARQYLWTWQAMKPYVQPGQVHLGPFVVEPDPALPVVDNLPEHLRLIRAAFREAGEPLPPWSAFAFNIYESPQLAIDHFGSYKVDYVRRLLPVELPGVALPLRFDEVGIHPLIASSFAAAGVPDFEGSRWAAAWHAEMLALLVEQEIEVGSPWLHNQMMRPYGSYLLASLASGSFLPRITAEGTLTVLPAPGDAAHGPSRPVRVRLGSRSADRVGHLWSHGADGATRLLVWHFPRSPQSDARLARDAATVPVRVRLPDCDGARCTVIVLGYDDQVFAEISGVPRGTPSRVPFAALPAVTPLRRVEREVNGELAIGLRPGEVYLIEVPRGVAP